MSMLRLGIVLGGSVALGAGIIAGSALESSKRKPQVKPERFSILATKYDQEVGSTEASIGLEKIRKDLIGKAHGKVLETCAGTGRNNAFYDGAKVTELVLVDFSKEMLEEALKKPCTGGVKLVQTIQSGDLKSFPDETFDSVVDTFGICSVEHPEEFLREVKRVLKPGGSVLLLEHGRAESPSSPFAKMVNAWLDFRAPAHADYFGCVWNRQISSLVERSGVIINEKRVHHFGTCTEIEASK